MKRKNAAIPQSPSKNSKKGFNLSLDLVEHLLHQHRLPQLLSQVLMFQLQLLSHVHEFNLEQQDQVLM